MLGLGATGQERRPHGITRVKGMQQRRHVSCRSGRCNNCLRAAGASQKSTTRLWLHQLPRSGEQTLPFCICGWSGDPSSPCATHDNVHWRPHPSREREAEDASALGLLLSKVLAESTLLLPLLLPAPVVHRRWCLRPHFVSFVLPQGCGMRCRGLAVAGSAVERPLACEVSLNQLTRGNKRTQLGCHSPQCGLIPGHV